MLRPLRARKPPRALAHVEAQERRETSSSRPAASDVPSQGLQLRLPRSNGHAEPGLPPASPDPGPAAARGIALRLPANLDPADDRWERHARRGAQAAPRASADATRDEAVASSSRAGPPRGDESRAAPAGAVEPPNPVLDRELSEVTAGGAIAARRRPGEPTLLVPDSALRSPSVVPGSPALRGDSLPSAGMAVTAPSSAGVTLTASEARGPSASAPSLDGLPDSSGDGSGEDAAEEAGAVPARDDAADRGAGAPAPPGARVEPEAVSPAADASLVELALGVVPGPNPEAIREQALASPEPVVEGDPARSRAYIDGLLATLRAEAARARARVQAASVARQGELAAGANTELAAVDGEAAVQSDAVRLSFAQARARLQAEAELQRTGLSQLAQKETARAQSATTTHVSGAESALGRRQTDLAQDALKASVQPPIIARAEADRADRELEVAAQQCERAGQTIAARYPGSEDSRPDQRAAARGVSNESAADIRDKKAPLRADLTAQANDFGGQYFEYSASVSRQITDARGALIPAIVARSTSVADGVRDAEAGALAAIAQQLAADLSALEAAERSAIARIEAAARAAKAEIQASLARANGVVGALAQASHALIEQRVSEVESAVSGEPEAATAGGAAAVGQATAEVAEVAASSDVQLSAATAAGLEEQARVAAAARPVLFELAARAGGEASSLQRRGEAALARPGQLLRERTASLILSMEDDQTRLETVVVAEVDRACAAARAELTRINDRFRGEVSEAANEAIEVAIKPRTDTVESRAEEAADQADDPWYEGLLRAVGQIIVGLVILVVVALVVAAIAAAFGVILTAWTAIMIAGAVLLAAGLVLSLIQRVNQVDPQTGRRVYEGRPGAVIGRAVLDAIGVTGIQEAWTGRDVALGTRLTAGQRTERGTLGAVTLISLVLGVRSAIKGPPGGVYSRPSTLPRGFAGIRGLFTEGVSGGLRSIGERMGLGVKSVAGEMRLGLRQSLERLKGRFRRLGAERPERWPDEFWRDDINTLPEAQRVITVDAANILATRPEFVVIADFPQGAWKWTLFDRATGAKFCEVYAPVAGNRATAVGGPELWLHTKQALLPNGQRVQVKGDGFRWTPEALEHAMRLFREMFGHAPANMSGNLDADNLGIFQKTYSELRAANPTWSPQQVADQAVLQTPFGKNRVDANYGQFRVEATKFGPTTYKGVALTDVPQKVRVEALPTGTPPDPASPLAVPAVPHATSRSSEDE